jgi:hypothetical protein
MPRCPVLCVRPNDSTFRITFAQAKLLVKEGVAEWTGRKALQIRRQGHGIPSIPEFSEQVRDSGHWANRGKKGKNSSAPRLSEDKQILLRHMKRLSA